MSDEVLALARNVIAWKDGMFHGLPELIHEDDVVTLAKALLAAEAREAGLKRAVCEAAIALTVLAHEEGQRVLAPEVLTQVQKAMTAIDAALKEQP